MHAKLICFALLSLVCFCSSAATYTVINTNDTGAGSLRQAIMDANVTPGNTVAFNIPPPTYDIYLFTALPVITNAMTFDGFTQPGSTSNTIATYGNNSTLIVNIHPSAQGLGGINVRTNYVTVRGLGFRQYQVAAVYLQSGNSNVVEGCQFGTDAAGLLDWGNGYMPVRISSSFNRIGGTNAWQHNIMGFNGGAGVGVFSGTNNAILGNSIFATSGLGIDLDYDQRTPNDPNDSDTGANQRQNFPVLTNVFLNGSGGVTVQGTLQTAASQPYRLEFFSGPVNVAPDYTYARDFVGWTNVVLGASGQTNFSFTFPAPVPPGYFICATATDTNGNTSELSAGQQIPNQLYVATPVGTLGHGVNMGTDLNNLGDAVGWAYAGVQGTNTHAFLFSTGNMQDLGTLGGRHSFARGINDSRVIVGYAETANNYAIHGFRWAGGSMQDLGILPANNATQSWAWAINSAGTIVGSSQFPTNNNGGNLRPVKWQNGVISDLGVLPGDAGGEAWGISDNGDIYGVSWQMAVNGAEFDRKAFLVHNGVMTGITNLYSPYGWPAALNSRSDLAVTAIGADGGPHGYALVNGTFHDFGLFGSLAGLASDINNAGDAVGSVSTPLMPVQAGGNGRAVLYRNGIIYDLSALLFNPPSGTLKYAAAINDRGIILANGLNYGLEGVLISGTSANTTNVYLLYPVQVDSTFSGNKLIFSWYTNMAGFALQTKTNIGTIGGWSNLTTSPVIIGDRYYLTNSPTDPRRFFRLYRP